MSGHTRAVRRRLDGALEDLTQGTSFIVADRGERFLITNRHIVLARDPLTDEPFGRAALPEKLIVRQAIVARDGVYWQDIEHRLYEEDGSALWLEHPTLQERVDVAVVPIEASVGPSLHARQFPAYHLEAPHQIAVGPSSDVSIIGFPDGMRVGEGTGIWTRGTVATEPELDVDDRPAFLVDARTRGGQSGSPVIYYSPSGVATHAGEVHFAEGARWELLGIYSSRTDRHSDLGYVWRPAVILETIRAAEPATVTFDSYS